MIGEHAIFGNSNFKRPLCFRMFPLFFISVMVTVAWLGFVHLIFACVDNTQQYNRIAQHMSQQNLLQQHILFVYSHILVELIAYSVHFGILRYYFVFSTYQTTVYV